MLKRNLNTLTTIILTAAFVASCTGENSPTVVPTTPATRDVPAGASPSPDPPEGSAAVPSATARPSDVIKEGSGGPVTPEQQEYLETNAEYNERARKLMESFDFWAAPNCTNRAFNPDSLDVHIKPVFSADGKTAGPVLEAFMDDDQWHTYAVPFGNFDATVPTAPENLNDLYEIGQNQGPLEVTGGSFFLGWDDAAKQFIRYDSTGKITERLGGTGVWEVAKTYPIANSKTEAAASCRIPGNEIDSWANFVRSSDTSQFPADVKVSTLLVMDMQDQFSFMMWEGDETGSTAPIVDFYRQNPDRLPFRVLGYCVVSLSDLDPAYPAIDVAVKLVKVIDSSGNVSYLKVVGLMNASSENVSGPEMIPLVSSGGNPSEGKVGYSNSTQEDILRSWAESEIVPVGAEDTWFWEMN